MEYMDMKLSSSSLDPATSVFYDEEVTVIRLQMRWPEELAEIYIPHHSLSSDDSNSNCQEYNRSTFHTLQKENVLQKIDSFSIYVDSQDGEVFQSDSDNDFLGSDIGSCDNIESLTSDSHSNIPCDLNNLLGDSDTQNTEKLLNSAFVNFKSDVLKRPQILLSDSFDDKISIDSNLSQNLDKHESSETKTLCEDAFKSSIACNGYKTVHVEIGNVNKINNASSSQTSLAEILDTTPSLNLKDFTFNYKKKDLEESKSESDKLKEKKLLKKQKKQKKKVAKYLEYDNSGIVTGNGQMDVDDSLADIRMHDFIQAIMSSKHGCSGKLQINNSSEFPDLATDKIKFIKSGNSQVEQPLNNSNIKMKDVVDVLSERNKEESKTCVEEAVVLEPKHSNHFQRVVIENVPKTVTKEDIRSLLYGYGKIQRLKCFSERQYLKVIFEIDSDCDIDWVIDCLNDTNPFGACSQTSLKCYKA